MDQQTLLTIPTFTPSPQQEPQTKASPSTSTGPIVRLTAVLLLVALSVWANFESSKLFDIKVINAAKHTEAGKQFHLNFVSNGFAERLLLNSSHFIEHSLFPEASSFTKKPVHKVTVYFSPQQLSRDVLVSTTAQNSDEFTIALSPKLAEVPALLHRGMARVWLWDGQGHAPRALLEAMAEFLVLSAGIRDPDTGIKDLVSRQNSTSFCWDDSDVEAAGLFFKYCDERRVGFVARLNRAMKDGFDEGTLDSALGSSARGLCSGYRSSGKGEGVIGVVGGRGLYW